jgi:hypothetical protein
MAVGFGRIPRVARPKRADVVFPWHAGSEKDHNHIYYREASLAIFQKGASSGVAYLSCSSRRQREQKPVDLLASLLKQLVQQQAPTPESVKSLYVLHRNKRTRPSFEEILKALHSVMAYFFKDFHHYRCAGQMSSFL